jgi:hypothetical protein
LPCPDGRARMFRVAGGPNQTYNPPLRGRLENVTDAGWDAVDAASALVREPDAPNAPVRFDEGECGNGDHGSAAQALPNERGGNRYAGPNVHRATLLLYR